MTTSATPRAAAPARRARPDAPGGHRASGPATADALSLVHVRGPVEPTRGPVLLVHGAGVRAEIFMPPTSETVVDALLAGWMGPVAAELACVDRPGARCLDAGPGCSPRSSRRSPGGAPPDRGEHAQGHRALPGQHVVRDVVGGRAASRGRHDREQRGLPAPGGPDPDPDEAAQPHTGDEHLVPAVSPAWGDRPGGPISRIITAGVRATHRECSNSVCRMVSFTYGTGTLGPVVPREPGRRHARLDPWRVRGRPDQLLRPDGGERGTRADRPCPRR